MARKHDYVTKAEFVEFKEEMMNAVRTAIAEALAPAKMGNGKAGISEAQKLQAKRERNCLTSKENKLVAAQMRKEGKDPSNKKQWNAAKRAYIKANPLG